MEINFSQIMELIQIGVIPVIAWIAKLLMQIGKNNAETAKCIAVLQTHQTICEKQREAQAAKIEAHGVALARVDERLNLQQAGQQ